MFRSFRYNIVMLFSCAISLSTILWLILYVLPHKGVDFADAGYSYYSALAYVAKSIDYSWTSIARPPILNAIFMFFGIRNIITLQAMFILTVFVSASLCLLSINKKLIFSVAPIATIVSLLTYVSYTANYQNTPIIFLMLGISLFFLAINIKSYFKIILLFISALLLSVSSFINISLIPAGMFSVLFLSYQFRKDRESFFLLILYVLSFCLCVFVYINFIGFEYITKALLSGQAHNLIHAFVSRMGSIFYVLLKFALVGFIPAIIIKQIAGILNKRRYCISKLMQFNCCVITVLLLMPTIKYIFPVYFNATGPKILIISSILITLITISSFIILFDKAKSSDLKLLCFFITGTVYLIIETTTTSNPILFPLNYYTLLFNCIYMSLFYLRIYEQKNSITIKSEVIFLLLMSLFILFGIRAQLLFAYGNDITVNNTSVLQFPRLYDVRVTKEKKKLISTLESTYKTYGCAYKPMLAFNDLPLLYYIFNRSAPFHQAWVKSFSHVVRVYPQDSINDRKIVQWLNENKHWCVFYSPGLSNNLPRKNIVSMLEKLSLDSILIAYKGKPFGIWVESAPTKYIVFVR